METKYYFLLDGGIVGPSFWGPYSTEKEREDGLYNELREPRWQMEDQVFIYFVDQQEDGSFSTELAFNDLTPSQITDWLGLKADWDENGPSWERHDDEDDDDEIPF